MARTPMSEEARAAASARMKARWAEKRSHESRTDRAIEHVASGVLRSELDEIEGAIDRRESSLSRLKTDEEVAGMRVVAANAELRKIQDLSTKAKEKLDEQLRTNTVIEKSLVQHLKTVRDESDKANGALREERAKLQAISAEISERLTYKEQQEKDIETVVEKGNDRLYEVDQEVKELLRKRDGIQQTVSDLEHKQLKLDVAIALANDKIDQLNLRYTQTADKYRAELLTTRATIAKTNASLLALDAKAEKITNDLVARSKSVVAREEAIAARESELVSRERLLKSRESRYS